MASLSTCEESRGFVSGSAEAGKESTPSWGMGVIGLLKHSRPYYQLGIVAIFCGVRYGIVGLVLYAAGYGDPLSLSSFWSATLATVLVASAGFLINDYFDRRHDAQEGRRGTPIGRYFTRRGLIRAHIVITFLALLLVGVAAYEVRHAGFLLLYLAAAGLLWFYSTLYKYRSWLSSLLLAFMAFSLPLVAFFFHLAAIDNALWSAVLDERLNLVFPLRYVLCYGGGLALLFFVYAHVKELWGYSASIFVAEDSLCMRYGRRTGQRMVLGLLLLALLLYAVLFVWVELKYRVGFQGLPRLFVLSYIALGVLLPMVVSATVVAMGREASQLLVVRYILRFVALVIAIFPLCHWFYFLWVNG